MLLLRPSTYVIWMRWLAGIRVPAGGYGLLSDWRRRGSWEGVLGMPASAARVDTWVGLGGPALTENITKRGGHQRTLLVHLRIGWHSRSLTVWEKEHLRRVYLEPWLPRHMSLHFSRYLTERKNCQRPVHLQTRLFTSRELQMNMGHNTNFIW